MALFGTFLANAWTRVFHDRQIVLCSDSGARRLCFRKRHQILAAAMVGGLVLWSGAASLGAAATASWVLTERSAELRALEDRYGVLAEDMARRIGWGAGISDSLDAERPVNHRIVAQNARLIADVTALQTALRQAEAAHAEAAGVDADALAGELATLGEQLSALIDESQALGQRRQELRTEQDAMMRGRGAADAAQDMRDAVAALQDAAERWMVLKAAGFLLHRGIDRFRRERQGPLLRRAEALFRTLTRGSFAGFRIDYDDRDNPVLLGVRADGRDCPVDGMSDGTRDQLFLALRLAAVEDHARAAEPMPFVADDLFVHFDDDRAAAGLDALIALGDATQVLLFTHHRHLADLARDRGGRAVAEHRLDGLPVAAPA